MQQIISDVHQGIGDNCKAKAMASHRGQDSTYQKCSERFFWDNMLGDVAEFVKRCEMCQKHVSKIMDAAQKLICKTFGEENNYQSVLNTQKNAAMPFNPVYNDHIQLLHDGGSHWFLSFCSSGRVQICNSLNSTLNRSTMKSVYSCAKWGNFKKLNQPSYQFISKQMVLIAALLPSLMLQKSYMENHRWKQSSTLKRCETIY